MIEPRLPYYFHPKKPFPWALLFGCILLALGSLYIASRIHRSQVQANMTYLLQNELTNTALYAKVTANALRQRAHSLFQKQGIPTKDAKLFIQIQTREDFEEGKRYYLQSHLQGYKRLKLKRQTYASKQTMHIAGCNLSDALPPETNLDDVLNKPSLLQQQGTSPPSSKPTEPSDLNDAPAHTVIVSVDILLNNRWFLLNTKQWFHRKCYFYPMRRPHKLVNELQN